jgi:hypothetical protein
MWPITSGITRHAHGTRAQAPGTRLDLAGAGAYRGRDGTLQAPVCSVKCIRPAQASKRQGEGRAKGCVSLMRNWARPELVAVSTLWNV